MPFAIKKFGMSKFKCGQMFSRREPDQPWENLDCQTDPSFKVLDDGLNSKCNLEGYIELLRFVNALFLDLFLGS